VAETLATSVLALPSSAALSDAEIDYITAAVREYYK
jgi:dTDP-4-amino-4,6-dideoxygalactose transaminase